jgi:hypothetical protein
MRHERRVAITVAPVVACGLRPVIVSGWVVQELLQTAQDFWIAPANFLECVTDRPSAKRFPKDKGADHVVEGLPDGRILSRVSRHGPEQR